MNTHSHSAATKISLESALAAVDAEVFVLPWKDNSWKKIRGSLAKIRRVYRQLAPDLTPEQIVCDSAELAALIAPYKKTKTVPPNCGFKSYQALYDCHSNVKRFFDFVSGQKAHSTALRSRIDGGAKLLGVLAHGADGNPLLNGTRVIPLASFINRLREQNLDIRDATRDRVVDLIENSSPGQAATLRNGAKICDELQSDDRVPSDTLPRHIFGDLSEVGHAGCWRTPKLHPDFKIALDRYIQCRLDGSKPARLGTHQFQISTDGTISPSRAKSIRQAVNWFHHGLVVAGIVQAGMPFPWDDVADPGLLKQVADLDASGAMHRRTQGETRGNRIRMVINFLDTIFQGYKSGISMNFFDYDVLNNPQNFETDKANWKRKTTLDFVKSPTMQKRYFDMPSKFYQEAKALINRWDQIGPEVGRGRISALQGRALDLAVIAVHMTVVTRFPLRLDTALKLTASGPKPMIIIPNKKSNDPVKVNVPGYINKNRRLIEGVPLHKIKSLDPAEIITWYLEKVLPLVIEHRVRGKNKSRKLLFGGATREPVARKFQRLTAEAGLKLDAHMVRHLAGSLLYARGVSVKVIAELLGITEATVIENYLYIDRAALLQEAVDEIAILYRELE